MEAATKWYCTATSSSSSTIHWRAAFALLIVSCVVNVLEQITNNVVSASSSRFKIGQLRAIDIRHAVETHAVLPVGSQCAACHHRAEIGTANADVDDIGQAFSRAALDLAALHALDERLHPRQDFPDFRHTGRFQRYRIGDLRPQRAVQYRPILGLVDVFAGEHGFYCGGYRGLLRKLHQQLARFAVDVILRVVEQQVVRFDAKALNALFIPREQLDQLAITHVLTIMRRQVFPGGKISGITGGEFSIDVGVGHAVRS